MIATTKNTLQRQNMLNGQLNSILAQTIIIFIDFMRQTNAPLTSDIHVPNILLDVSIDSVNIYLQHTNTKIIITNKITDTNHMPVH